MFRLFLAQFVKVVVKEKNPSSNTAILCKLTSVREAKIVLKFNFDEISCCAIEKWRCVLREAKKLPIT